VIEAVIFDYGGVISSPLFRGVTKFETDMGYPPGAILELVFGERSYVGVEGREYAGDSVPSGESVTHDWHRLEIGAISVEEWFNGVMQRAPAVLGREIDVDAYLRFMNEMPIGVHWYVVHKVMQLRDSGMPLALLTNNVKEWGGHWRTTFPVDELFPIVVDSSEVGMRKPNPRIYELTCARVGVAPDKAVFVDDNSENCAAARALGMETVLFGDDPFAAMDELDTILERRGTRVRG
jgi:epoxide hydrolase-like predicted phosphatase